MAGAAEHLNSFFMPLVMIIPSEILIDQSVCVHAAMLPFKSDNALDRMDTSGDLNLNRTRIEDKQFLQVFSRQLILHIKTSLVPFRPESTHSAPPFRKKRCDS